MQLLYHINFFNVFRHLIHPLSEYKQTSYIYECLPRKQLPHAVVAIVTSRSSNYFLARKMLNVNYVNRLTF